MFTFEHLAAPTDVEVTLYVLKIKTGKTKALAKLCKEFSRGNSQPNNSDLDKAHFEKLFGDKVNPEVRERLRVEHPAL